MIVSMDESNGRVMVLADDRGMEVPGVRVDGSWRIGTFSADDLKDNFSRVTGKEADMLFQEAFAALSSNPHF